MTTAAPTKASDADLLRRYAASRDEGAFAALADRYLPLVYSAAVRQTRDPHLAEDVAQAALVILSQKAGRIDPALLPGWLLKTTHYAARNALRQRARRIAHEQRAAAMKREPEPPPSDPDAVARVIDPALARLRDADRTAVVLRYFQDKSFAEVAAHLRTTEAGAQRRIARAVEKLRAILARQGVTVSAAALPATLAAQALHPVPPSLLLHATSLAGSKAGSTLLIAKGALHAMAAAKLKAVAAIAAAVLLVGAAVPTAYHYATARPEPAPAPAAAVAAAPLLPPGTDMSRPASGSLPPGMTAEPLAIMNMADGRWIRPTGGEMADLPHGAEGLRNTRLNVQGATHALLCRITAPDNDISWRYSVLESGMYGSTGAYDVKTQTNYQLILFAPKAGTTAVTLTVSAATGPWTHNAVVPASATAPTVTSVNGLSITFDPPTQDARQVHIRRRMDRNTMRSLYDLCGEFYGVTEAGTHIGYVSMSSDILGDSYAFNGQLSVMKEFRLNTRPYNYRATYTAVPLPR